MNSPWNIFFVYKNTISDVCNLVTDEEIGIFALIFVSWKSMER